MTLNEIHEEAKRRAKVFKNSHREILEILFLVDEKKVHLSRGYGTLWQYMTKELELCDADAGRFLHMLRASQKVPEFKEAVTTGEILFSNAACVAKQVTQENKEAWIEKAKEFSVRELKREIAKEDPKVKIEIKRESFEELKRVQDVLSQRLKRPASFEEVISEMAKIYLKKKDPVAKAERLLPSSLKLRRTSRAKALAMTGTPTSEVIPQGRVAWPAWIKHQVYKKFQGQCGENLPDGSRCTERRHLDIHHIVLLSEGGSNHPDNLKLLCRGHHRAMHIDKNLEWLES